MALESIFGRGKVRASYRNRWRERKAVKRAEAEARQAAYNEKQDRAVEGLLKSPDPQFVLLHLGTLSVSQQARLCAKYPICPL